MKSGGFLAEVREHINIPIVIKVFIEPDFVIWYCTWNCDDFEDSIGRRESGGSIPRRENGKCNTTSRVSTPGEPRCTCPLVIS